MKIFENLDIQDLEGETWKNIEDYPDYMVSNLGRVKSFKRYKNGKILKQQKNTHGYFQVDLCQNGISKSKQVHRLVYETHKEKLKDSYDVHHINGDKENNFVENLEPILHNEHLIGKIVSEKTRELMSERIKGEYHPNHKLKDGEVWLIKKILNSDYYKSGKITQKFIGKMFDIDKTVISKIKLEKLWSHVIYEKIC